MSKMNTAQICEIPKRVVPNFYVRVYNVHPHKDLLFVEDACWTSFFNWTTVHYNNINNNNNKNDSNDSKTQQ